MSNFLTDLIPWKEFIEDPPGECLVRLRAGGTMAGFEISGPYAEGTSDAELEAKAKLVTNSIRHFGTGDMIHAIYNRVTASEYPRREFPTPAARMIDEERARHFQNGKYYRNLYAGTSATKTSRRSPISSRQCCLPRRRTVRPRARNCSASGFCIACNPGKTRLQGPFTRIAWAQRRRFAIWSCAPRLATFRLSSQRDAYRSITLSHSKIF